VPLSHGKVLGGEALQVGPHCEKDGLLAADGDMEQEYVVCLNLKSFEEF